MSQAALSKRLQTTPDSSQRRDIALQLLSATHKRQYLDEALRVLKREAITELLDSSHRDGLRQKAIYYFEHNDRDKAGMLRESITRLLVHIGHPDDLDIYLQGVETYYRQPVNDVAQNLRAVALVGLVTIDETLGLAYATKLLGEDDTSQLNCEPAMTAVDILSSRGRHLPIYQFLLLSGEAFIHQAKGEVVGKALESLGADFPLRLYQPLAEHFVALDVPIVSMGVVNYVIDNRIAALYSLLETLIENTNQYELHQFTLIMMAASRNEELTQMLYRLAKFATQKTLKHYIEAVDVSYSEERDAILGMLHKRL